MGYRDSSDTLFLIAFFAALIAAGALALALPISAAAGAPVVAPIDALFVATSAVCVTGLTTVDLASLSRFGQLVVLFLIQAGGLGIISVASLVLMLPGRRLPFRRLRTIRGFSVGDVEHDPRRIVRNIVLFTFGLEALGALALYPFLAGAGVAEPLYSAVFHAVSAFCNAGFSLYRTSLEGYAGNSGFLGIIAFLIVAGGIGFIVIEDLERFARGKRRRLSAHSSIVLGGTAVLVLGGALAFWALERDDAYAGMRPLDQAMNALFQSITPRTAGFDAVAQSSLGQASRLLTMVLMFVGGSPGSIAGGIKVSTAVLVLLVVFRRANERGEINALRRRFSPETTGAAVAYFLKAAFLLLAAVAALSVFEGSRGAGLGDIVFEAVSAFGTVGLSLDFTKSMGTAGKLVIVATMFAGRVGLVALAFPSRRRPGEDILYPEAELLIG